MLCKLARHYCTYCSRGCPIVSPFEASSGPGARLCVASPSGVSGVSLFLDFNPFIPTVPYSGRVTGFVSLL